MKSLRQKVVEGDISSDQMPSELNDILERLRLYKPTLYDTVVKPVIVNMVDRADH